MPEEQEMSMNEILSSIRQILSDETTKTESEPLDDELEDVFVLTPSMRYNEPSNQDIQTKMKLVLNKLADQKATMSKSEYQELVVNEVRPILTEWMTEMMPSLVKQAVDQEIKKLIQ